MNLSKLFLNLVLLNHASPSDAIYEEVTPCVLQRLIRMARAQLVTWCHVGESGRFIWHD
jgi:hypothetical protein